MWSENSSFCLINIIILYTKDLKLAVLISLFRLNWASHYLFIFEFVLNFVATHLEASSLAHYFLNCACIGHPFFFFAVPVVFPKVFIRLKHWQFVKAVVWNSSHHWCHNEKTPSWYCITVHWSSTSECFVTYEVRFHCSQCLESTSFKRNDVFTVCGATFRENSNRGCLSLFSEDLALTNLLNHTISDIFSSFGVSRNEKYSNRVFHELDSWSHLLWFCLRNKARHWFHKGEHEGHIEKSNVVAYIDSCTIVSNILILIWT